MKILVTGNAGFLGSHLVDALIKEGHDVYGIDDLSGGYQKNVNKRCGFFKADLRNKELTESIIKFIQPEIVYHLAADATEGRSQFQPKECTERGLVAFMNLIVPCIQTGKMKRFVFTSSMAVYGEQTPPFSEELPCKPEDVYGVNKAAQEHCLEILAGVHEFEYVIIRPHNIIGERQNMADPYRNVLAIFVNCLLRGKNFYIYGDGKQKRSFSYVGDMIPCLVKAGFCKEANREIINLGPVEEYSINELSKEVMSHFPESPKPKYLPARPLEVKYAWCTNDKAKKILGFKTKTKFKDGVARFVAWATIQGPMAPKYKDELELDSDKMPITWRKKLI